MAVAMTLVLTGAVPVLVSCSGAKPAPQASASAAMTLAAYRQFLNGIDATLAQDTQRIRSARTPPAVSSAAAIAEGDVDRDVSELSGISAPARFKAAQAALISALRDLRTGLAGTGSAAAQSRVCAGSSAMAMISSSTGAVRLRSAGARLVTADPAARVRMTSFLPPATAATDRRLANGTVVKPPVRAGPGEAIVINNGSTDAVVTLALGDSRAAAMAVYVRAGSPATVKGIGDGSYQVYVTSGTDWDTPDRLFTRNCAFERFDRAVAFVTTATHYTEERITITPSAGGNVRESRVPPSQFPAA